MLFVYCEVCGLLKYAFGNDKDKYKYCPICNNLLNYRESDIKNNPQITKMSREEKNKFIEDISGKPIDLKYANKLIEYDTKIRNKNHSNIKIKTQISCPYCKSTNCKKIGVVGRSVSVGLFGLGSKKIGKQFHCNNCKADF